MTISDRPNWDTDEVLVWLAGKFPDRREAIRAIELQAEAGNVAVLALDGESGERVGVSADAWCDLRLKYSDRLGCWVIADVDWSEAVESREVFRSDLNIGAGGFSFADLEADQKLNGLFGSPRWRDPKFRAHTVRKTWPIKSGHGGRPPNASWEVVQELLSLEVARRGMPDRSDGEKGWRTNADVARWIADQLEHRGEAVEVSTIEKKVPALLKAVKT